MRFRLANTSWRGLRFHFAGDTAGAYACMLPPLALALLPVALAGAMAGRRAATAGRRRCRPPPPALIGLGMLAFVLALPYFLWRVKRYQHGNYAIGGAADPARRPTLGVLYGIFIKLIGLSFVGLR